MKLFISNFILNAAAIHTALNAFTYVNAKGESHARLRLARSLKKAKAPKQPNPPKGGTTVTIVDNFCPVQTIPASLYDVHGSTTELTAGETNAVYGGLMGNCLGLLPEFDDYFSCTFPKLTTPNNYWSPPIYFINDGFNTTHQIVDAGTENVGKSPGSINDTMFKGKVNCDTEYDPDAPLVEGKNPTLDSGDCSDNKVIIKFQDFSFQDSFNLIDPLKIGSELWNVPINQIEYIEYDFYPISCPNYKPDEPCPGQFYIGIYTHQASNVIPYVAIGNPLIWYNCRYNFIPSTTNLVHGTGATGAWSTFRIYGDSTLPSGTSVKGIESNECSTAPLQNAPDTNLLGSNYLEPTIFILNIGDSTNVGNGLAGYFDNIRIKILGQPVRVYDL